MDHDAHTPQLEERTAPIEVLEATRALLWIGSAAEARTIAERLVGDLGGEVVAATDGHPDAVPADISFGDGCPLLPVAKRGTPARAALDHHLGRFLLDARQAIELCSRNERLNEAATTDSLTGLPNRRSLTRALARLRDRETVVVIDLDHFKQVNDTLGHAAGDTVLRAFGQALLSTVRARDLVGRFGGEEFVVVLGPPVGADAFLRRLQTEWLELRPLPVTFSAGIAVAGDDASSTVARADRALYVAKRRGRDRWEWAPESDLGESRSPLDDDLDVEMPDPAGPEPGR